MTIVWEQFYDTLFNRVSFRDNLWRDEVGDPAHVRELTEELLGTPVASVSFSELRTDEAYLERLRAEIGENLEEFRSSSVEEALSKYLGSSIRVVPDEDRRDSG